MAEEQTGKQNELQSDSREEHQGQDHGQLIEIQAAVQTRSFAEPLPFPDVIAQYTRMFKIDLPANLRVPL